MRNPFTYLCAMNKKVRVRFAPSPTGGLHLGGVRTVLYNYLFAKKHHGDFVLRIEDTDQSRYVEGAEQYILDCLDWCGLHPDEGPHVDGPYAPYRQSERKGFYKVYAGQLVKSGHAYYAFDTTEEIELMRERLKASGSHSLQYDHSSRGNMKNSLTLLPGETQQLLDSGVPYVIRIMIIPNQFVEFNDMIRGEIQFDTNTVDDKVLLKADGMPTYHLAVVVDDYLMKISHAFRGEEWLPSAPVHILLWKYLGWEKDMPEWAHLPLILKPDGNGKLSKRDGERLGFPVFAMNWQDPNTGDLIKGFKELGFLPEAFLNLLAVLGWNDGSEQEIFSLEEMIEKFSIGRVHKTGAKFDFEKAKWFNHEWIKRYDNDKLSVAVSEVFAMNDSNVDPAKLKQVVALTKDRCTLLTDFLVQGGFFFKAPGEFDLNSVKPKWDEAKAAFFKLLSETLETGDEINESNFEAQFKELAAAQNIKIGELQMIFRIILVGSKIGPPVFSIAAILGKHETKQRIITFLAHIASS